MPRSFLVKQPKSHDSSSSSYYHQHQQHWDDSCALTHAITESTTNLAVRLSENGEFSTCNISSRGEMLQIVCVGKPLKTGG